MRRAQRHEEPTDDADRAGAPCHSLAVAPYARPVTALPPLPGGLEKRIRDRSGLARRATRAAIAAGRVAVDGAIVRDAERLVYPDEQLALDGQPLEARADAPTFLLHKPTGVTTTTRDPLARELRCGKLPESGEADRQLAVVHEDRQGDEGDTGEDRGDDRERTGA